MYNNNKLTPVTSSWSTIYEFAILSCNKYCAALPAKIKFKHTKSHRNNIYYWHIYWTQMVYVWLSYGDGLPIESLYSVVTNISFVHWIVQQCNAFWENFIDSIRKYFFILISVARTIVQIDMRKKRFVFILIEEILKHLGEYYYDA